MKMKQCLAVAFSHHPKLLLLDEATSGLDPVVRGEMLGLRALLHFDLLRMFGKGNLGNRRELLNTFTIPYSLDFNKYAPAQVTYEQFLYI